MRTPVLCTAGPLSDTHGRHGGPPWTPLGSSKPTSPQLLGDPNPAQAAPSPCSPSSWVTSSVSEITRSAKLRPPRFLLRLNNDPTSVRKNLFSRLVTATRFGESKRVPATG